MMVDISKHMTKAQEMGLSNGQVPVEYYTSPEYFRREQDMIFRRAWLMVGRVEEVAEPGDFVVRDMPTLDASVITSRGKDGKVRAFHNQCAHRGVALVCQERGNALTFRCPYHAWVYRADGSLSAIPSEKDFPHVDKDENGLAQIHLETWNGFIFLNFAEEPEVTLHQFLAGLDDMLEGAPFEQFPFYMQVTDEIDCNWKNLVNAFNEGYHVAVLHQKTLRPAVVPKENPHLHSGDVLSHALMTAITEGQMIHRIVAVEIQFVGVLEVALVVVARGRNHQQPCTLRDLGITNSGRAGGDAPPGNN